MKLKKRGVKFILLVKKKHAKGDETEEEKSENHWVGEEETSKGR